MRVPTGVRDTTMYFCPRLSELSDLKFAANDTHNYIDFDSKMMVIQTFKNVRRPDRPPRKVPLTDEIMAMFRNMQKDGFNKPLPKSITPVLEAYLRPLLNQAFGNNNIILTNNSLRSMVFNDAWYRISNLPDLKPHELLVFNENLITYHDHTLATAIVSYSRSVPPEEMAVLTTRIKQTYEHTPQLGQPDVEFAKKLVQEITVYSLDKDDPPSPNYQQHSEHYKSPSRPSLVRMEGTEPEPANPQLVELRDAVAAVVDRVLDAPAEALDDDESDYNPGTPLPADVQVLPDGPSLPASPHLPGPLEAYAPDADAPRAKRKINTDTPPSVKRVEARTALSGRPMSARMMRAARYVNHPTGIPRALLRNKKR
jgi:hypothetical protein